MGKYSLQKQPKSDPNGKIPSKQPKMAIFDKIDFSGLKYPPEKLVELKTCSTKCGTHVHTILNQKNSTGSAGGAKNSQNWPIFVPSKIPNFWPIF